MMSIQQLIPLQLILFSLLIQYTTSASNTNINRRLTKLAFITRTYSITITTRNNNNNNKNHKSTSLHSLKPAAIPLMSSGKALARSGELLIDLTSTLNLYGGSLSASGACLRNSGDCLAQAAASCRFKTAVELVIDELREGADCLREGREKLDRAVEESGVDGDVRLMERIGGMIRPMGDVAMYLEKSGKSILDREGVEVTGRYLVLAGEALEMLALAIKEIDANSQDCITSSERMVYASQQMILAGEELKGGDEKKVVKGKGWLKNGL